MASTKVEQHFQQSADEVWQAISSFRKYEWGAGVDPGTIEDGRSDNEVGCIRAFNTMEHLLASV